MQVTTYTLVRGRDATAEIDVKKSRFVAVLRRVESEEEARGLIAERRRVHHAARHHCSAYVIGTEHPAERANDDGEPGGSAGAPMLDVLRGRGLTDVAAVVSRYFGGTLLGTGGLVKAYGDAVRSAVDDADLVRRERLALARLVVEHDHAGQIEAALRSHGVLVRDIEYGDRVTMTLAADPALPLDQLVAPLLGHEAELVALGTTWVDAVSPS